MSARTPKPVVPLAYQRAQAAAACGVSGKSFDEHIRPHLRCVYIGDIRLWSVAELQHWLDASGSTSHDGSRHGMRPRAVVAAGGMAQEDTAS